MGSSTDIAEWQVAHWTKMSHQRSLIEREYGKAKSDDMKCTHKADQDTRSGQYRATLKEDHAEDLNPLTKDWRKSLRTWENGYWFITDHPPTAKNKKKIRWNKEENMGN